MYERYTVYRSGGSWYIGDFMDIQTYDNQQATGQITNIGSYWNPSYVTLLNETETADLCANGHNLTIGRSVIPYNDYCARYINGLNAGITSSTNFTMRIESGIWGNFNLTAHYRMSHSNTLSIHGVIGSDYDRAEEDNTKLSRATSMEVTVYIPIPMPETETISVTISPSKVAQCSPKKTSTMPVPTSVST